jgi:UDP-glucuronate decarboxylase
VLAELLDQCSGRFLFVSSSEVYSGLPASQQIETQIGTTGPTHPRAPYIEAKRFGETLTLHGSKPVQTANVARLSLAYGPGTRLDDQRVLNELILRGIAQHKVELRGGSDQLRSYIFIEDAVYYLLKILLLGDGGIYNVGGLETITLGELAVQIGRVLGVEAQLNEDMSIPTAAGAPTAVGVDMKKTLNLAGVFDHYPLNLGLRATVDWYRRLINQEG